MKAMADQRALILADETGGSSERHQKLEMS